MAPAKFLYDLLGLRPQDNPGPEDIKKAYHTQASKVHPDKNIDDSNSTARFQRLHKAYEQLLAGSVFIEEVHSADEKDGTLRDNTPSERGPKLTKRQTKKAARQERWAENTAMQRELEKQRTKLANEIAREQAELDASERFNRHQSKLSKGSCKMLLSLEEIEERKHALILKQTKLYKSNQKPKLNSSDMVKLANLSLGQIVAYLAAEEQLEQDAQKDLEEARFEITLDEWVQSEMPIAFAPPEHQEQASLVRSEELLRREAEEDIHADEKSKEMAEFWEKREVAQSVKPSAKINYAPKKDRYQEPVMEPSVVDWTKERLAEFAVEEAIQNELITEEQGEMEKKQLANRVGTDVITIEGQLVSQTQTASAIRASDLSLEQNSITPETNVALAYYLMEEFEEKRQIVEEVIREQWIKMGRPDGFTKKRWSHRKWQNLDPETRYQNFKAGFPKYVLRDILGW